jgi:hypothetical protein
MALTGTTSSAFSGTRNRAKKRARRTTPSPSRGISQTLRSQRSGASLSTGEKSVSESMATILGEHAVMP